MLADLDAFVRIPGVSAQPGHQADVQRSAEWFAQACRDAGFPTVEAWPTAGLPAVFAEWRSDDPGARVPADDAAFLEPAKCRALAGEKGFTTLERIGARPAAEVKGIWRGYTGTAGKTIIPSDAHVKPLHAVSAS